MKKVVAIISIICLLISSAVAATAEAGITPYSDECFRDATNVVRLPNGVEITMTLTSQPQPPQKVWAKKIRVHTGTNMDTEPLDRFFAGRNANVTSFTHYASSPENGYGIRENTAESTAAYHSMSFSAGLLDYQKNDACWVLLSHESDSLAQTPTGVSFSDDICALWEYLDIEVSPEARNLLFDEDDAPDLYLYQQTHFGPMPYAEIENTLPARVVFSSVMIDGIPMIRLNGSLQIGNTSWSGGECCLVFHGEQLCHMRVFPVCSMIENEGCAQTCMSFERALEKYQALYGMRMPMPSERLTLLDARVAYVSRRTDDENEALYHLVPVWSFITEIANGQETLYHQLLIDVQEGRYVLEDYL